MLRQVELHPWSPPPLSTQQASPAQALPRLTYQVLSVGAGQLKDMKPEEKPESYGEEEGIREKRW